MTHANLLPARSLLLPRARFCRCCLIWMLAPAVWVLRAEAAETPPHPALLGGAAKVDITDYDAGPVNDPLFVKVVALQQAGRTAVVIGVDAVAIGEIGPISNTYLPTVRQTLQAELGIDPADVLVNASHCHGVVCADVAKKTVEAVRAALANLDPVRVGAGTGHEDRIMENRRLRLKNGQEADVRHAYSLPQDSEIAGVGPVDPEIGILRLDRDDGRVLAVIYNFACHPIQGVPSGANTADMIGFASKVIEENLSDGTIALFLQGCGGDINPVNYKQFDAPRDAEPLGNQLGLSTLRAVRRITCRPDQRFSLQREVIALPRADHTDRIARFEAEQRQLLQQLQGTTLNFKTFLPLLVKYESADQFPSNSPVRYMYEEQQGRSDTRTLDAGNRQNLQAYLNNIQTMEELTRLQTNMALLRKHQASLVSSGKRTIDVELLALRVGDFVLLTFPGELTSPIGLNIKKTSPHELTFVAGYTNGYIYYAPTAEQLQNPGSAQEDCDCLLAPEWQEQFESTAARMLQQL